MKIHKECFNFSFYYGVYFKVSKMRVLNSKFFPSFLTISSWHREMRSKHSNVKILISEV